MSYPFSLWEIPAFVRSLSLEVMPVYPSKLTSGGPCLSTEQPFAQFVFIPRNAREFPKPPACHGGARLALFLHDPVKMN